jgi:hypothetical protein
MDTSFVRNRMTREQRATFDALTSTEAVEWPRLHVSSGKPASVISDHLRSPTAASIRKSCTALASHVRVKDAPARVH